eukprot:scaffold14558_cov137-Cylindrotheca_fusiformis.AAC.18
MQDLMPPSHYLIVVFDSLDFVTLKSLLVSVIVRNRQAFVCVLIDDQDSMWIHRSAALLPLALHRSIP